MSMQSPSPQETQPPAAPSTGVPAEPLSPFLAHHREVHEYLTARVGCSQLAADLLQDAYVRILSRSGEAVDQPRAFLFRIANNAVVDHWRRERSRRPHLELAEGDARQPDDAHAGMERRERLGLLQEAIADLPTKCREVFLLHRFSGLSYGEIAERAGISVSTVEKHMIKALAACRRRLAEAGH